MALKAMCTAALPRLHPPGSQPESVGCEPGFGQEGCEARIPFGRAKFRGETYDGELGINKPLCCSFFCLS